MAALSVCGHAPYRKPLRRLQPKETIAAEDFRRRAPPNADSAGRKEDVRHSTFDSRPKAKSGTAARSWAWEKIFAKRADSLTKEYDADGHAANFILQSRLSRQFQEPAFCLFP
jgi:hypothetical protein